MPHNWPTVSCIVNTYKRADLLPRALQSVLNQTYSDYEVIVVHDGPPDVDTANVLNLYQDAFDQRGINFVPVYTDECSGYQCVPKNKGTELADGDYIAYLDDDNEWEYDHLEVLVTAIEAGTVWPDVVYGRRRYVRDPGSPTHVGDQELREGESPFVIWDDNAKNRLATSAVMNFIDTGDFLVAKGAMWSLLTLTGMWWNENLRRFADWELVTRGAWYGGWRFKEVDAVVQTYHWTGKNLQLTRPPNETPKMVGSQAFRSTL